MRLVRYILYCVLAYLLFSFTLAIILGEWALRPVRIPLHMRTSAQSAFARFGAGLQDVSINASDGTRLEAWFARPASSNGNAVILVHGVGDNREGMVGFAQLFLSSGYSVLLPDSRGNGLSGGFPTYGILEARDVHDWYNWLENSQHVHCVFGMGESMGAAIVLQSTRRTPFCAVVAESPFADFRQIAYIRVGQIFHSGEWVGFALRPTVELALVYGKLKRGVYLANAAPDKEVRQTRVPILLIHGLQDSNIPARQSELIRAQNPEHIVIWEVPGADHCGASSVEPEQFRERVLSWFNSHELRRTTALHTQSSSSSACTRPVIPI